MRLALFLLLTLTACGPTVKVGIEGERPRLVALLPIQAPKGTRGERVTVIRRCVERELRNNGFSLLDDALIGRICEGGTCSNPEKLFTESGAQGSFLLEISSVSKNNFLAGYVDQISGTLHLQNKAGQAIASVRHRETESGGLLFHSGQILQGLMSSIENYGDAGFNLLAEKFARTIVSKVPRPRIAEPSSAVTVSEVSVQPRRPSVYRVCARGTPHSLAYLGLHRTRSTLREVAPGEYCGIYWLSPKVIASPVVEIRSPFGDVARRDLPLEIWRGCDLRSRIELIRRGSSSEIALRCDTAEGKRSVAECARSCAIEHFVVYRAPNRSGPFEKVGEMSSTPWRDPAGTSSVYSLVAVARDGSRSLPITPDSRL